MNISKTYLRNIFYQNVQILDVDQNLSHQPQTQI